MMLLSMPFFGVYAGMCMKQATDVFNDWAHRGKDEGMERGHGPAVREMLDLALGRVLSERDSFSFADLGCGNGWVVRLASRHDNCTKADGFDGAEHMIVKAKTIDSNNGYHLALFPQTKPPQQYDFIHSMEFIYYLHDPKQMLQLIHDEWLTEEGWVVIGIDHYAEHEESLGWPEALDVHMSTFSEREWIEMWKDVGFRDVHAWRANRTSDKPGTLAIIGKKGMR
jgi:SAM-dependent methyltransferase